MSVSPWLEPKGGDQPTMPHVLMLGEPPEKSAPILTLAQSLKNHGFETMFSEGAENRNTREWVRLCRQASVLVVVKYDQLDLFFTRQLAIAVALGRPVIRWWVGTDVLQILENPTIANSVRNYHWLFSRQIAVSPHLAKELETVGIQAQYIPSVIELDKVATVLNDVPKSILIYLPTQRKDFYGAALVEDAIKAYPGIEYVIVADEAHSLAGYPNVRSMGWVSEMSEIWNSVGGLVRITRHDGMPRMVLEALRRGKHVIFSTPFPGCILSRSKENLFQAITSFSKLTSVNMEGISQVKELLTPDPGERFSAVLTEVLRERKLERSMRAIWVAITLTYKLKTRAIDK